MLLRCSTRQTPQCHILHSTTAFKSSPTTSTSAPSHRSAHVSWLEARRRKCPWDRTRRPCSRSSRSRVAWSTAPSSNSRTCRWPSPSARPSIRSNSRSRTAPWIDCHRGRRPPREAPIGFASTRRLRGALVEGMNLVQSQDAFGIALPGMPVDSSLAPRSLTTVPVRIGPSVAGRDDALRMASRAMRSRRRRSNTGKDEGGCLSSAGGATGGFTAAERERAPTSRCVPAAPPASRSSPDPDPPPARRATAL